MNSTWFSINYNVFFYAFVGAFLYFIPKYKADDMSVQWQPRAFWIGLAIATFSMFDLGFGGLLSMCLYWSCTRAIDLLQEVDWGKQK